MAISDSYWSVPTLRVQADQVAGLPPKISNGKLRFILTDSYSESSDRPGGRSSGRSIPLKWWFEIHTDRFLFCELRQIEWQIYPCKMAIWDSHWKITPLRALPDQVAYQVADLLPKTSNGNLRFILIDSYSESSGRSSGRSTSQNQQWQIEIHTDRFLLWELR